MIHPRTVILTLAAAFAIGVAASPSPVIAQPAGPSAADIAAAKKAFGEGKALFEVKKYGEAVDKFKESYRLSKNPLLLYNIAVSLGANNQEEMALFYYKKFLSDAPADAAQRPDAEAAAKTLESKLGPGAGKVEGGGTKVEGGGTKVEGGGTKVEGGGTKVEGGGAKVEPPKAVKIKPVGTYSAADFKHRVVEEAPPGKHLDLTAVVPADSGFAVTLFYRGQGEAQFTPVPMKWRYNELVGRILGKKMGGTSIQYYIEVKDTAGGLVTKVAKPASPNVVYLEPAASAQFYPDFNPDAASTTNTGDTAPVINPTVGPDRPLDREDPLRADTSDDPLAGGGPRRGGTGNNTRVVDSTTIPDDGGGGGMTGPAGSGFMDVGSSKFKATKWGTTAVGGALFATSIIFYFRAANAASTLEGEADLSNDPAACGANPPPCREFDDFLRSAESTGKSSEMISKVTLGAGILVTGIAAYYWIKELRGAPRESRSGAARARRRPLIAVPAIGDGVIGGAAAVEW